MKSCLLLLPGLALLCNCASEAETVRARTDEQATLVLGRKPVFPIELYGVRTAEDFAIAKAHGFNAVIEFGKDIESLALRHGMILTDPHWYNRDTPDMTVLKDVERRRDKPAVFAYNLNDEPDIRPETGVAPSDLERIAALLHEQDPARLVSITCSGGAGGTKLWKDYAALVDIFRIDPYPVVGDAPLSVVPEQTLCALEATGPRKPVWVVLQAWTLGPGTGFPTARQDRCMTYLALAAGAKGISHFDFNVDVWSQHPDFWNGLMLNNHELRLLSPVFLEGERVDAQSESPHIRVAAWRWRKSVVLIVANEETDPVDASVTVSGMAGKAVTPAVLFKNRLTADELIPLRLNKLAGDLVSADVSLGPFGVQVIQLLPSRMGRRLDPCALDEVDVRGTGIQVMDSTKRGWVRLKNVQDAPSAVSLRRPGGSPEVHELDLAFRPIRRVASVKAGDRVIFAAKPQTAYEVGRRPTEYDPFGDFAAFRAIGLDLELILQYPAPGGFSGPSHRFRAFTGAKLPVRVIWSSKRPVDPGTVQAEVVEDSWKPRLLARSGEGEKSATVGWFDFLVEAPRPARPDRDEVLPLRISRGRRSFLRCIRFRMEKPFDLGFEWQTGAGGVASGQAQIRLKSRFPGYSFEGVHVRPVDVPEGWTVSVQAEKPPRDYALTAAPPREGVVDGTVCALSLQTGAKGAPNERFQLPRLLLAGGKLHVAVDKPRRLKVPQVAAEIAVDGLLKPEEWSTASRLVGFLDVGVASFAGRQPKAWLCRKEDALFLAAELPVQGGVRARSAGRDDLDTSDDLIEVYLDTGGSTVQCIFMNPNGVMADFALERKAEGEAEPDMKWSGGATAAARVTEASWTLELRIPFSSLSDGPPKPGTVWRFNLRTPHGIAPRFAEVFSFSSTWQPQPDEFALMEF